MEQQTAVMQQRSSAFQKVQKPIDALKGILNASSVQTQFVNALGKSANTFIASLIDLYNTDAALQSCNPKQVVMEALKAAVLHLPLNKALGYAYLIMFNNNRKDANGNWVKVYEPVFQMGYKGYIQLAMRTGQYRTINADVVYEGELRKVNKLTGEIAFDGDKVSDKVVGYFCYFELINGFSKTLYMTVEQIADHAKRFSKGLSKATTVESLLQLAAQPMDVNSKAVGWTGNFHAMAIKTVIRMLLSKYGYLSIEMQSALTDDAEGSVTEGRDEMISQSANSTTLDIIGTQFEEVSEMDQRPAETIPAQQQEVPVQQEAPVQQAAPVQTTFDPGF